MIENEASRVRSMNGLCFSGTATGLNLRNSPKHFNREAEFLPGWSYDYGELFLKLGSFTSFYTD